LKLKTRDLVIAAAVCAAVGIPALAYGQQAPPTVSAVDVSATTHKWDNPEITIAPGQTVTFQNTTGTGHNADFTDADKQPTCTQTSGTNVGAVPPLPKFTIPHWTGTCTFSAPGDYPFICDVHADMTGVIHVVAPGQPTPTATATPTATPVASATPGPGGGGSTPNPSGSGGNTASPSQLKLSVAKAQTGGTLRGNVMVEKAGSKVAVSVWAAKSALQHSSSKKLVQVGHVTRTKAPAGRLTFKVVINSKARSALRRHRRLSVTVEIALTPPGGHELTRSVKSTLRMS
jgi:plastocyanin